jgi:predicted site-specific integrase-resolvase
MVDKYVVSTDVCKFLHISKGTLHNYVKAGMPHLRLNRKLLFELEEVEKWVKERASR